MDLMKQCFDNIYAMQWFDNIYAMFFEDPYASHYQITANGMFAVLVPGTFIYAGICSWIRREIQKRIEADQIRADIEIHTALCLRWRVTEAIDNITKELMALQLRKKRRESLQASVANTRTEHKENDRSN